MFGEPEKKQCPWCHAFMKWDPVYKCWRCTGGRCSKVIYEDK